jgi:uncharacterized protein (TIGR02271 family)
MITQNQLRDVIGATAYDRDGDKIGKIGHVYYDDDTDQPKWITVNTGFLGTSENFVPLAGAEISGDGNVTVGYDKATIKDAPNVDEQGHLSPEDEQRLYRHYNLQYGDSREYGDNLRQGGDGRDAGWTAPAGDVDTGVTGRHADRRDVSTGYDDRDRGTVGHDTSTIKDAPHIAEEGHLSPEDEQRLYRHYDLDYGDTDRVATTGDSGYADTNVTGRHADRRDVSTGYDDRDRGTVGHDTSGPTTDNAMTRSEERLNVGTETREAGRARLRKHVVTEQQQVSVPVSHEELRVEREPITDANRGDAYDGPSISEEEHEVTLRAERPVVSTETEAVERVRLGTETVRSEETVSGEVRKEEIEVDDDVRGTDRDRGNRGRV